MLNSYDFWSRYLVGWSLSVRESPGIRILLVFDAPLRPNGNLATIPADGARPPSALALPRVASDPRSSYTAGSA